MEKINNVIEYIKNNLGVSSGIAVLLIVFGVVAIIGHPFLIALVGVGLYLIIHFVFHFYNTFFDKTEPVKTLQEIVESTPVEVDRVFQFVFTERDDILVVSKDLESAEQYIKTLTQDQYSYVETYVNVKSW